MTRLSNSIKPVFLFRLERHFKPHCVSLYRRNKSVRPDVLIHRLLIENEATEVSFMPDIFAVPPDNVGGDMFIEYAAV